MKRVFAVVQGNYYPMEIDLPLYKHKEMAQLRADKLGGQWCVKPVNIDETKPPEIRFHYTKEATP